MTPVHARFHLTQAALPSRMAAMVADLLRAAKSRRETRRPGAADDADLGEFGPVRSDPHGAIHSPFELDPTVRPGGRGNSAEEAARRIC